MGVSVRGDCPSYLNWRDCFTAGPACEDVSYAEREQSKVMRDERTEARRARNVAQEEHRWRAINAAERAWDERGDRLRKDPMIGRKNISGQTGYNVLTHSYDETPVGAILEHHDNMIKYRGCLRSANIAMRGHLGFNPISGEQVYAISIPPP